MKEIDILNSKQSLLIDAVRKIIMFDTVKSEATDNAPFGEGNAQCLEWVLQLCQQMGGKIYNADNYAGHADFGEGEEIFGILGHLDVVPANEDGWLYPPFSGTFAADKIFGRGALDDKSPMIACLFAVKSLLEAGYKFKRKVRLIFGCDEESGMHCMEYYFTKVLPPDMAISPDANFPIINREKGIIAIHIDCGRINSNILDITSGARLNVVPDKCVAKIKKVDITQLDKNVAVQDCGDYYQLTTYGKSSHGATPQEGDNASWKMLKSLAELFDDDTLHTVYNKFCDYTGKNWGIDIADNESGHITLNIGMVRMVDNTLKLAIDCRHPVTFTNEQVVKMAKSNNHGMSISVSRMTEPLFVPEQSPLVQDLLRAYSNATGKPAYTIAIGGGTYSRCMTNCVAYGPEFPNEEALIHQPNEYVTIDVLMRMAKVYMEAIKTICCE
ncbi:MAG: Sapep family Mn(2+)-dependent dipeptidase [Clostridia bacterium]|nr:Sapep family Mn(2+)-dependent dipeptidase [Clostridia bacterium]